jgi:hypothetical protein
MTKDIAGAVRDFFGVSSAKPYSGKDTTLGTYSSVGSGFSGRLKPGDPDDFLKLLEQRVNKMPARPRRAPRGTSRRSSKRKAPRGRKTYKRKAPIRKSTKRKKRKVSTKSKSISLTTGTIRQRNVEHTKYSTADALYIPMNSIGPKDQMCKIIAQALLVHYMHRVGDYRASAYDIVHTNGADADEPYMSATWETMKFVFIKPSDSTLVSIDLASDVHSLVTLTSTLGASILAQLKLGRRLATVLVYRSGNECVLSDVSAGRNMMEFSCKALLKLQNTTIADTGAGITDDNTCGKDNAMNINRNPLDGLVYKFKNAVPKWKQQFMIANSPFGASRPTYDNILDTYSTSLTGIAGGELETGTNWAALQNTLFDVPPPAPTTIWSNGAGKYSTGISPGGHKSYAQAEYHSAPVNSFFDRYFPVDDTTVPPGGSCIVIGLKPKYRNTSDANVTIQAEVDHTYAARVSRAKVSPLPMNTILS